jgi:hypothetical protein
MASRSNKETRKTPTYRTDYSVGESLKRTIKDIGWAMKQKATKVPDRNGKSVSPRSRRDQQIEEAGG